MLLSNNEKKNSSTPIIYQNVSINKTKTDIMNSTVMITNEDYFFTNLRFSLRSIGTYFDWKDIFNFFLMTCLIYLACCFAIPLFFWIKKLIKKFGEKKKYKGNISLIH